MLIYYKLVGTQCVPCDFEELTGERITQSLWVDDVDTIQISTIFLCLDHGHGDKPELFETMVFCKEYPDLDGAMLRYATHSEAEKGHKKVVKSLRKLFSQAGIVSAESLRELLF